MNSTLTVNRLFLASLLLAEITRHKFGKEGMSLTHPSIERNARKEFAQLSGIPFKSQPKQYLTAIGKVYAENNMSEYFETTLTKFKLNPTDFK